MKWPWTKKPVIRLNHTPLTLEEWLASPPMVDYARELFRDRSFRAILSVLHNEAPIPNEAAKPEALAGQAMLVAGYMRCLNTLLAMATPPVQAPDAPDVTYEAPSPELTNMGDIG